MRRTLAALLAGGATAAVLFCATAPAAVAATSSPGTTASPGATAEASGTWRLRCTIIGTPGDDVLRGTSGSDVICGLGGDDRLLGLAGDDVLNGGPGDDRLRGGPGNDTLNGGPGDDTMDGGSGSDTTRGGPGTDRVVGEAESPETGANADPASFPTCAAVNAVHAAGVASTLAAATAAVATGFLPPLVDQPLYNALVAAVPALDPTSNGIACEVTAPTSPPTRSVPPTKVRDLQGGATSPTTARLQWRPPTEPPAGSAVTYTVTGPGTIEVTGETAVVSGLTPDTPYTFAVTPANAAGPGPSEQVELTTHKEVPAAAQGESGSDIYTDFYYDTGISPRMQWNANSGYCGETSFITALMRNGGYASQWTVRQIGLDYCTTHGGCTSGVQTSPDSQLLLYDHGNGNGVTSDQFAQVMRLAVENYPSRSESNTDNFLAWIKEKTLVPTNTVIIGVYNNVTMLEEGGDGDPVYDHIVPVVGVGSDRPLSGATAAQYFTDDTITISDNGLYTPIGDTPGHSPNNPSGSALYTNNVYYWQNDRSDANKDSSHYYDVYSAPIVQIASDPANSILNWGTAVTGFVDTTSDAALRAVPVQVSVSADGEGLQNEAHLHAPPAATAMTLTATAQLAPGIAYTAYGYDDFAEVPTGDFHDHAAQAAWIEQIGSESSRAWSMTIPLMTDQTLVIRVVPLDAP